jgi:hypothetical protein
MTSLRLIPRRLRCITKPSTTPSTNCLPSGAPSFAASISRAEPSKRPAKRPGFHLPPSPKDSPAEWRNSAPSFNAMKTNLSADFDKLARAAIDNEATDVQLEELELAIMESADGADVFRDMAESDAVSAILETASPSLVARGPALPARMKVVLFGPATAVVAVVTLVGAGLLYLSLARGPSPARQLAGAPVAQASGEHLSNDEVGTAPDTPIAAVAVPEPSTSLLLLTGFAFVLLRRSR